MEPDKQQKLGLTADNKSVFLDSLNTNVGYHLLETPNLIDLVQEVLPTIHLESKQQVVVECDLGRVIGTTNLVETTDSDDIIYAKRIGRDKYSRFARNREPVECSSIVVVLRKGESGYYLWTAMCGKLLPVEAQVEDSHFNKTHAMAFEERLVQLDTVTKIKPSNDPL